MRMKLLGAALGGLALVAVTAVSSQAEPSKPGIQKIEASAAADIPCWTSFNPSNPNGGSMVQYYRNCNPGAVAVGVGFVDGGGQASAYPQTCTAVAPGAAVAWSVPYTFQGVNYQSVICRAF